MLPSVVVMKQLKKYNCCNMINSENTTSPTTALIFKLTDVGVYKYNLRLKFVKDDYKNVMLF